MPVRIDASGDYLRRTSGLIDYQSAYTVAFWYSLTVNSGASYEAIFTLSGGGSAYDELFLDASNVLKLECSGNSAGTVAGRTLLVDRWYHIVVVRKSTSLMEVYVDGQLDITNTTSVASRNPATPANMSFGTNAFSEWTNGRFANAKAWQAALSRAEIIAESGEFANVRQANIYAWWPMLPGARTVDWSGNVRVLTEGGTLTDEAGPLPASVPTWWLPIAVDAAVTIAPSVSDAVTIADAVTLRIPVLLASVNDAVTAAETATVKPQMKPSRTDAVAVAEAATVKPQTKPSRTDAVTISESASASVQVAGATNVSVTDAVTIADTATVLIPILLASGTDAVTVSEAASASVQVAGATNVSVTDSVTVGETAASNVVTLASANDAAALAESTAVTAVTQATVNDGVAVGETANASLGAPLASATEAITVNEAVTAIVSVAGVLQVNVTDAVAVGESVTVSVQAVGMVPVTVTDGVTVIEGVAITIKTATVTVTDGVAALESVTVQAAIFINVVDAITATDALTVAPPRLQLAVNDDIQADDTAYGQASGLFVSVGDAITTGELVALSMIAIGLVDATVRDYATWQATLSDRATWRKTLSDEVVSTASLSDVDRT